MKITKTLPALPRAVPPLPYAPRPRIAVDVMTGPVPEPPSRLDDIAAMILALTYGEMLEFAAELWAAQRGDGMLLDAGSIPQMFNTWARDTHKDRT